MAGRRTDGIGGGGIGSGGPPLDHAAALRACAGGDRQALADLYARESPQMTGVALRILRRRDLAEEAVHDAFIQIWRGAARFDPRLGSGRSWIYAVLRNRTLNLLRDGSREDSVPDDRLEAMLDAPAAAEDIFDRLAETGALRRCLAALGAPRRASLLLAYAGGFTHGEIAGRMGVPLGTVKAWIRRGLAALKACLS